MLLLANAWAQPSCMQKMDQCWTIMHAAGAPAGTIREGFFFEIRSSKVLIFITFLAYFISFSSNVCHFQPFLAGIRPQIVFFGNFTQNLAYFQPILPDMGCPGAGSKNKI